MSLLLLSSNHVQAPVVYRQEMDPDTRGSTALLHLARQCGPLLSTQSRYLVEFKVDHHNVKLKVTRLGSDLTRLPLGCIDGVVRFIGPTSSSMTVRIDGDFIDKEDMIGSGLPERALQTAIKTALKQPLASRSWILSYGLGSYSSRLARDASKAVHLKPDEPIYMISLMPHPGSRPGEGFTVYVTQRGDTIAFLGGL